jgi:antitoxin MazE
MKTVVQQWGNSLALRIPNAFAQQTSIKKGSPVNLTVKDGPMVMQPLRRRKYTLQELVSKITPKNRHPETDWGKPMGKEIS